MKWIRTALAIIVGLLAISLIVEPLEFGLVTLLNNGAAPEPGRYLEIRNQPLFLGFKFFYNFLAAVLGGYLGAWVGGRRPILHGFALAVVQSALFVWAMSRPEMRAFAPIWAWAGFIVATAMGAVFGSVLRARRTFPADLLSGNSKPSRSKEGNRTSSTSDSTRS